MTDLWDMSHPSTTVAVLCGVLLAGCGISSSTSYQRAKGDDRIRDCGYVLTTEAEPGFILVGAWTEMGHSRFYCDYLQGIHCDSDVAVENVAARFADTGTELLVEHVSETTYRLTCPDMATVQKKNDHLALRVTILTNGVRTTKGFRLTRYSRTYISGGKWLSGC